MAANFGIPRRAWPDRADACREWTEQHVVEGICLEKPPFLRRFSLHNEGMSDRERAI